MTIFLAGCLAIIGIIIQTTPFVLGQFIAARVITGKTHIRPMYVLYA